MKIIMVSPYNQKNLFPNLYLMTMIWNIFVDILSQFSLQRISTIQVVFWICWRCCFIVIFFCKTPSKRRSRTRTVIVFQILSLLKLCFDWDLITKLDSQLCLFPFFSRSWIFSSWNLLTTWVCCSFFTSNTLCDF